MTGSLLLDELTRDEVRQAAPASTVIIPVAATEQHGPHLPLQVDRLVTETLALRAAREAARQAPVLLTPALAFGSSHHHQGFGALSLSSETLSRVLMDVGVSLVRMGFRSLIFLNGHGGNDDIIRQCCRDLALQWPVRAAGASYWTLAAEALAQLGAGQVGAMPGHAGGFETSLMLALRPDLVRQDRYPAGGGFPPTARGTGGLFVQQYGVWQASGGYSEPPVNADGALGEQFLAAATRAVAQSIVRFHQDGLPFLAGKEVR
jgi:creatinine amidohydrolase